MEVQGTIRWSDDGTRGVVKTWIEPEKSGGEKLVTIHEERLQEASTPSSESRSNYKPGLLVDTPVMGAGGQTKGEVL